jgi:hypothetical protein
VTYAVHVETSAPRPGKRFEPVQERELHETALTVAEDLPGASRGLVVVPEFAGPIGIPDFTAYVGPTQTLLRRQRLAVPAVVSDIDAGIVSAAHTRRPLDARGLSEALGWPVSTIAGRLRRLVVTGALLERRPGLYVRPSEIEASGRLYAIETKIEDWGKALRQVRTYRVWADAYVLVMTGLSGRTTEALLGEVRRDRGGLVVDGIWLARPRLGRTDDWRRLQAVERFAAVTERGLRGPTLGDRVEA